MHHIVILLGCLTGHVYAGYQQFYYTNAIPQHNFYHQPIQQPYYYQQPIYQPYIQAPTAYATIPQVPIQAIRYQQPHLQYLQVQDSRNFNVQSQGNVLSKATQEEVKNDYESQPSDSFRGFAYHNEFEHGGRSNVVFLTGPEVNQFSGTNKNQINIRTSASDAIDSNAPVSENESVNVLEKFFTNPKLGVQKFYAVNNALVAGNSDYQISQYKAPNPINSILPVLRSRFAIDETTNKIESATDNEMQTTTSEPYVDSTTVSTSTTTELVTSPSTTVITTPPTTITTPTPTTSTTSTTTTTTTEEPTTTARSTMAPIVVEDITNTSTTSS